METTQKIVSDVYATGGQSELNTYYQNWAHDYDNDVVDRMGYQVPREASEDFARIVTDKTAKVLDVGAGTGLVGQHLKELGFRNVDALDASQQMLDVAQSKGIYRDFICSELGGSGIDVAPDTYDATICVGTYTFGHVKAKALSEVLDITKANGVMCFTQRLDFFENPETGFKAMMAQLEQTGRMSLIEKTNPRKYLPLMDPDIEYSTWIYRKL